MVTDRKSEVINICLDHFIEKGLAGTSTRSLSSALKLQNAGLYYYFESKDDAVISCADEAAIRLENTLLLPAMKEMSQPELMIERLLSRADEMAPTMKFFVTLCASKQYSEAMKPVLDRLAKRYEHYAEMVAEQLGTEKDDVEPYVYLTITAVSNYMIFAESKYIDSQMSLVKEAIKKMSCKNDNAG